MDTLIQALAIVGIALGIISALRPRKILRYGFYASVLAATGLRIARSLGRGEAAGFLDTLLAAFLVTALASELIMELRKAKR